jgi:4-amino-4-deoxy-L-arabinose transferase-like glycosyltransferase
VSPTAPSPSHAEIPWWRDLVLLSLVFGALLAWKLGSAPLANPDEGRYAEVPREMVASGDWVTPRLNGVPYFEKPPLVYWAVAMCEKVLGPSEWSLRLTPAAFALAGILMAYAAARKIYGRDAGVWSGVVLGTSLLYVALSRLLLLDMAVSVLLGATLFCFILGVGEAPGPRRRWLFYGLYASAALATLTKGLMGFLLTGAVMFLWLILFGQWRRLRPLHLPSGIALFLAIAVPWHVFAALRNPGWAHFYFVYEQWQRYTEAGHARPGPFWYFIPVVLLGLFPWTGFLLCSFREVLAAGWARRREHAEAWFFATWAVFIFLFFSASKSKLIPYILPVFPPIAVLIGRWLAAILPTPDAFLLMRRGLRVFAFLCGLLAAALCFVVLKPGIIRGAEQAAALRPYAFVMAAVLCVGGIRALVGRGGDGSQKARGALVAMTATLVFMFGLLAISRAAIQAAVKPGTMELAIAAKGLIRPGDRIFHYHNYFQDFPYYSGQVVGLVDYKDELETQFLDPDALKARFIGDAEFRREWDGTGRILAVARIRDAAVLFGEPGFRYHILAAGPGHYLFSNQP